MADTKSKPVNGNVNGNGNHVADKTAAAAAAAASSSSSKLRQLLELAREVTKDADAIEAFDTSVELRRSLEEQLEAKNTESQTLREVNDKVLREYADFRTQAKAKEETIFAEFEQRYKRYDSNQAAVAAMEAQVRELEQALSEYRGAEGVKQKEVELLKERLEGMEKERKGREEEMRRMQVGALELEKCRKKLALAEEGLGGNLLKEHDTESLRKLGLDLKALSKECHALALEYFFDPDGAKDSASEIQDLKARFPKVPLSTASNRSAAQLRCAVAEAVLAEAMMSQIFVPFYLPATSGGLRAAAASLLDLFGDDEFSRSVYRTQVLRSLTKNEGEEERQRIEDEVIRRASNEARTALHPLVSAFKQAGFFNAVPVLFRKALRLWADVQLARDLITAEMPVNEDEQQLPPGRVDEYDQQQQHQQHQQQHSQGGVRVVAKSGGGKPTIAAVLFPQVVTLEDIIFNGVALWSDQVAAPVSMPPLSNSANGGPGHHGHHHTRRKSVVAGEVTLKSSRQVVNGA